MADDLMNLAKPELPEPLRERLPHAQAHAEEMVVAINAAMSEHQEQFSRRFRELQSGPDSKMRRLIKIRALADDLGAVAGKHAACSKSCNHCCHIPVAMLQVEADLIGRAIGVQPRRLTKSAEPKERGFGYHMPCPFLKEGACSIYEHRPFACRVHFNLDKDPLLCELLPDQSITVPLPLLNVSSLQMLYIATMRKEKLGDIRDFFPKGADCGT